MDQALTELRGDLGDLRQQVEKLTRNPVLAVKPSELPPLLPMPIGPRISAPKEEEISPSEGDEGHGLLGRRVALNLRGKASGEGLHHLSRPRVCVSINFLIAFLLSSGNFRERGLQQGSMGEVLKLIVHNLMGEIPTAWKMKCETYFRVSGTSPEVWVGVAALQFSGGGGRSH